MHASVYALVATYVVQVAVKLLTASEGPHLGLSR